MKSIRYSSTIFILFLILAVLRPSLWAQTPQGTDAETKGGGGVHPQLISSDVSVRFLENRGQVVNTRGESQPDILYTVDAHNATLYFFQNRISYVFRRLDGDPITDRCQHDAGHDDAGHNHRMTVHRVDMELVGARTVSPVSLAEGHRNVEAQEKSEYFANFYLAHCPDGITGVSSYRQLVYRDIYPHIDMILHAEEAGVKCDFIVRPGGRVSDIRMKYVGADESLIAGDGGLRVTTPLGWIEEDAPVTFQERDGQRRTIDSRFIMHDGTFGFDVGEYDSRFPLTIDPNRKWSTYYGGSGNDNLNGGDPTEVDRGGNVLFTGWTTSNPFPTTTGTTQYSQNFGGGFTFGDAFVVKFSGTGTRLWATYYGGTGDEISHGIASDVNKNIFITGHVVGGLLPTSTNAYITSPPGSRDAFVVKFDSNGTRIWGTYAGGNDWDDGYGFGVDSTGNVAVLLTTATSGLQTSGMTSKPGGSSYDILILKLSPSGARLWSTYIGGNGTEYGYAGASDIDDNIIVTGWTNSSNFPTTTGAVQTSLGGSYDAFVSKFSATGTLQFSTYYGGTGTEGDDPVFVGYSGIATDGEKNIFIAGHTTGSFPTTAGAFQGTYGGGARDAFVVKFSPTGTRRWATYVGGNSEDVGVGCASSAVGSVLVTGFTNSNNLPVTTDAYQPTIAGNRDVFIVKLDSLGAREYVSYYGGSGADEGEGISFDPDGAVAVAGNTQSTNFPTQNPYQGTNAGQADAFAVVFCDTSPPKIDSTGPLSFCWTDSVTLFTRPGYYSYFWSTGALTHSIKIKESGKYWLRVTSASGCIAYSDTFKVTVYPRPSPYVIPEKLYKICEGDSVTIDLAPKQFLRYLWNTGETTRRIRVGRAGTYFAIVVDSMGCVDTSDIATVTVNPRPPNGVVTISPHNPTAFCEGDSVKLTATLVSGTRLLWSTGERTLSIWAKRSGYYKVSVVNEYDCPALNGSDSVYVTVNPRPSPPIIPLGATTFCQGDSLTLTTPSGYVSYLWSTGDTTRKIVVREAGRYELTVTDDKGCVGSSFIDVAVSEAPHVKLQVKGSRTLCEGDSVVLDPGSGYASYRWNTGDSTQTLVVKESGTYSVRIGDAFGCTGSSDTVRITVIPRPDITINGPEEVCANTTAQYEVTGGSKMKYVWTVTGGGGTIQSGQGTNAITVKWGTSANGTGKVSVKGTSDSTGCSSSDELTVTISTRLVPRITGNRSFTLCDGDSVTLNAGSYETYLWSTGETTRTITVKTAGVYTVTVTQGTCSGKSNPVTITVNAAPQPTLTATTLNLCPGKIDTIRVVGTYSKYQWASGERVFRIFVTQPGTYTCTVTDSKGCTGIASITILPAEAPKPEISGPLSLCLNSEGTYTVTSTSGSSYKWTVNGAGGTIVSGQNTASIKVRWGAAGNGTVVVEETNSGGCKGSSESLVVTIGGTLTPKIIAEGDTVLCLGDSVRLTAPAGYSSYSWSTGAIERSITVGIAGVYRVTVTDDNGCSGSDSITVAIRALPEPFILPSGPVTICPGDSIELVAAPGYVSYLWSSGQITRTIWVTAAGSYSVTATNEDGCRGESAPVVVNVAAAPATPDIAVNGDTLTTKQSYASYQWYLEGVLIPGATGRELIATAPGSYTVIVTTVDGCTVASAPTDLRDAFSHIELGEYKAVPGQRLNIPIVLKSSRNLDFVGATEYTMTLRFDRTVLHPTGSTPDGALDTEYRTLTITGQRGGVTTGSIGTIEVIAALGDTLIAPLMIDRFIWNSDKVAVTTQDGLVTVDPEGGWKLFLPEGRLTLVPPRPNPTLGVTELTYETIEPGRTQLYVVDMLGQRIATIVDKEITEGRYTVMYDAAELAASNYFLVLQTPTGRAVQVLQVEH
jgi:hypothetical protein